MELRLLPILFAFPLLCLAGGDDAANLQSQMDTTLQEIKKQIGDAKCETSSQCKTLPIGAKPCGGPWEYLIYSTLNTNEEKLKSLASEHKQLNQQYNKASGVMSDCMMVMPPELACVEGKCQ